MKCITIIILAFGLNTLGRATEEWTRPILPLSQVRPGMAGIGKTVFYGDKIEEFNVEVLDIAGNYYPQLDIIVAKVSGNKVEKYGIVSGMSGSPVYIDGKLVGALAFRFGSFQTEPIGGIMPIEYMLQVFQKERVREQDTPARISSLPQYIETVLCGAKDGFWLELFDGFAKSRQHLGTTFTPIHAPLSTSGINPRLLADFKPAFSSMGFELVPGSKNILPDSIPPLQPGSAVCQVLVSGDMSIEGSGTVTDVFDNKILAFGHYVFNLGPVNLPLGRARVLTTLPSLMGSSKMISLLDIVGSVRQDRMSGIYGDLDKQPKMIPVTLTLNSAADGESRYFFKMADDYSMNNLTPFYLRIALIQAMTAGRLAESPATISLEGSIHLQDGRRIKFNDMFSARKRLGYSEPGAEINAASDLVSALLGVLLVNNFQEQPIEKMDLKIDFAPAERIASLHSIRQDKTTVSPGDSLTLNIHIKDEENNDRRYQKIYKIPEKCKPGRLLILVSNGATMTQYEMALNRQKFIPVSYDHLLQLVDSRRKNDKIYIQIRMQDNGLLLKDKELSSLPPSVLSIMDSRRSNGEIGKLRDRVIIEDVIPTDLYISGAKRLFVNVKQKKTLPFEIQRGDL
ncbi:hypothetical protein JW935_02300 [candidate division KSB1 bacterium]|nr:hypothetical protein [candidate division KSB1 bacterium]